MAATLVMTIAAFLAASSGGIVKTCLLAYGIADSSTYVPISRLELAALSKKSFLSLFEPFAILTAP